MNKEEIGKLVAMALANFPNMQEKDMGPTMALWQQMLSDMPYDVAKAALMRVLATAKFFPTVAEIREAAVSNSQPNRLSAPEAWEEATRAIRKYGYYKEQEGLDSLSPATRKAVQSIGWKSFCTNEDEGVLRGQFRMAFETMATRDAEVARLPQGLKDMIGQIGQKMIQ
ncbi:replicative helicase loader/inhibitor [Dehalobacter sp. DCM]|uniref:replicative helicase loader/inhibitor n=1 Tax=Dehalobacter sp. DCM TaxID=2907827 RepID=UPI00308183AB|nr:replicative helicase loader/inhibitor [Dehalobacter sp. DCM]